MNDVWLVMQLVRYDDGSSRGFVSSVHGTKESAERRLSEKEVRHNSNRRIRSRLDGVVSSELKVERWLVQ